MEPLSKLSLNNQIVSMRHIVRKSKVHTINKLSREAKKLKEKKGTEEQVIKNKNKADRFVNELMVIKKLKDDDVSKYALQNEIPMVIVLNSVDITLETRARARLAGHQFITDAVQSFRNKYPDWKLSITELMNDLGAKHRTKNKPNKKKTVKVKTERKPNVNEKNNKSISEFKKLQSESDDEAQSESDVAQSESDVAQSESDEAQSESDEAQSESDKAQSEFEAESGSEEALFESGSTDNENNCNIPDVTSEENLTEKALVQNKSLKNKLKPLVSEKTLTTKESKNLSPKTLQIPKLVNTNFSSETKKSFNDVEFNENPLKRKAKASVSSKISNKKKLIMVDDVKPVCETIDSFFMTADDKDYMSVYKPPPPTEKSQIERPKSDHPKPPKEIYVRGKKIAVIKPKHSQNFIGNRRERRQQQVEEPVDTVLHPSWEAKRKQKSLAKFEGKKITFEDED